jgi:Uma2 family endonuclease
MAIGTKTTEGRMVLSGISWATYEAMLADAEHSGTRLTYDRGYLEMMSPSREHERLKRLLGRMIEALTEELGIPISSAGSTTFKLELERRGLEPDECYYVANEPKVRGRDGLDLSADPPPDLAVEVEITSDIIDKLSIYADLGVPEIWSYDGERLRVVCLQGDRTYAEQTQSGVFPFLPLREIERFLAQRNASDETSWIRSFRAWVKTLSKE